MKELVGYCVRYRGPDGKWIDYRGRYMQPSPRGGWGDTRYVWPTLAAAKEEVAAQWRERPPGFPSNVGVVYVRVVRNVKEAVVKDIKVEAPVETPTFKVEAEEVRVYEVMKEIGYCVRYKSKEPHGGPLYMCPKENGRPGWGDTRYVWPTLAAAKAAVAERGLRTGVAFIRAQRMTRRRETP
jgi:hypothetical protein